MMKSDFSFKVVVIGDSTVGKTNIIQRFTKDVFMTDSKTTIGVEFANKHMTIKNYKINLNIWDTAGQERYRAITNTYYRGAHGAVCVYDITKRDTFLNMTRWIDEVKKNTSEKCVIMLLGNKSDLVHLRNVSAIEGTHLAQAQNIPFFESSAKDSTNIVAAFDVLAEKIFEYIGFEDHYNGGGGDFKLKSAGISIANQSTVKPGIGIVDNNSLGSVTPGKPSNKKCC